MAERERYLTPNEVSERMGGMISVRTLQNWRCDGSRGRQGPPYVKLGNRVAYPESGFQAWLAKRTFDIDGIQGQAA